MPSRGILCGSADVGWKGVEHRGRGLGERRAGRAGAVGRALQGIRVAW